MKTFTLLQAREGRNAVRMVSVRAAVPFIGSLSATDTLTFTAIIIIVVAICVLVYREARSAKNVESGLSSLEDERNRLSERVSERTRELVDAKARQLEELNRTAQLGEISRGLFHDLMGPLTAVSMYLDKLGNSTNASSEAREVVKKVVSISQRMNEYMESVRRCIGTIPSPLEPSAHVSRELLIIKDILGYKARTSGITLSTYVSSDIILNIHPIRLHQLLYNLTNNALDACIEHARTPADREYVVTIDVRNIDGFVKMRIRDNGCGMTQEESAHIFTHSKTTKSHGLGIGIKTVKHIIDELRGTISVSSSPGHGSEFTVTIPS
jgi:C4-dicarboxylate-specific signal transduction histidine kinase